MGRKSRTKSFTCNSTSNVLQPPNYPTPSIIFNKTDNVRIKNNVEHSCNHCYSAKAISISYSECVFVALGIEHKIRTRHIFNCGLSVCTICFSKLSHKRHNFRKKSYWTLNVCWFSLQLLSETFFILRKTERDVIISVYWFSCKVRNILVRFSRRIFQKHSI